jgi:hypothetical protein
MRILSFVLILLTSSSTFGQVDSLEESTYISREEAIDIAKREEYFLLQAELDSNQWIVVYSKGVGITKDCISIAGGCYVHKNVSTVIDARTGKIKKETMFNTAVGGNENGPPLMILTKRKKKMMVMGRKITVYY